MQDVEDKYRDQCLAHRKACGLSVDIDPFSLDCETECPGEHSCPLLEGP